MIPNSRVIVIMGPTGAGKSALALDVAKRWNGEIINADSRQIYVGMDVGTDKVAPRPTPKDQAPMTKRALSTKNLTSEQCIGHWSLDIGHSRVEPVLYEGIPHYLIDILTLDQRYSAAQFRDDAGRIIADIQRRGKLPVVVGGTGFYIRALTGHQELPNVPPDSSFRAWAETQPVDALAEELRTRTPDLFAKVDSLNNRRRVTRYLEIARGRKHPPAPASYKLPATSWSKLALLPPSDILRTRIETRVDDMLRFGFLDEVRRLVERFGADAPGLQTIGYRQALPFLRNDAPRDGLREALIRAHWDYARRQLAWLKHEPRLVRVETPEVALATVADFLGASAEK